MAHRGDSIATCTIIDELKRHSREMRDLDLGGSVDHLQWPVDALLFLREYVAANKPCVLTGAMSDWGALAWDEAALAHAAGDALVTTDWTPDGRGDAVTPLDPSSGAAGSAGAGACFCTPAEERMSLRAFLSRFRDSQVDDATSDVPYLQHQNSNLTEELPGLLPDTGGALLAWAAAVFGAPPDASNVWIGDERAVTSYHRDHYENIYAVAVGAKVFHLLPPSEGYRLALAPYPAARYARDGDGRLAPALCVPPSEVAWSPVAPRPMDAAAAARLHPLYWDASLPPPLVAEVGAGQVLYLPAMWYHHVSQAPDPRQRWTIAVNYWFDMHFGSRYALIKLAEGLARHAGLMRLPRGDGTVEGEAAMQTGSPRLEGGL